MKEYFMNQPSLLKSSRKVHLNGIQARIPGFLHRWSTGNIQYIRLIQFKTTRNSFFRKAKNTRLTARVFLRFPQVFQNPTCSDHSIQTHKSIWYFLNSFKNCPNLI